MSFRGGDAARRDVRDSGDTGGRPFRPESAPQADTHNGVGGIPEVLTPSPFTTDSRAVDQSGPTPPDKCENVLASGAKWNGTLTVDSSVRIDGVFSGQIISNGTVHVAEGAQVDAKIQAVFVAISGDLKGQIHCEQRTDLLAHGRVRGDVITKTLIVQEGAVFDGHVRMNASGTQGLASRSEPTAPVDVPLADRRQDRRSTPLPSVPDNGELSES
jgi:cytoskeletal protein CcmA (bactofilin family)